MTPRTAPADATDAAKRVPTVTECHGDRREDDYAWLRDKVEPGGQGPPRGRERLHLRGPRAPRPGPRGALRGDARAHQGDRRGRALAQGGVALLRPDREGPPVPDPLPPPRPPRGPRGGHPRPERARPGRALHGPRGVRGVRRRAPPGLRPPTTAGFREYTLHVKDLETGRVRETVAERTGAVAWAADNRTLFYTVEEESTKRHYRLYRHELGTDVHDLVFEEEDPAFNVGVDRRRSGAYLVLDDRQPDHLRDPVPPRRRAPGRVAPRRRPGPRAGVRGRPPRLRALHPRQRHRPELPPGPDAGRRTRARELAGGHSPPAGRDARGPVDCFRDHPVVFEREDGLPQVRVTDLGSGEWHRIELPEAVYSAYPEANAEFDTTVYRYGYESLVTPPSVFDYDMNARTATLLKQKEVLGGYDPAGYVSRAALGHRRRRREGAGLPRPPARRRRRRHRAAVPLRLRLVRLPPAHQLLVEPPEPPRPRGRGRPRPRPRRRRPGQAVARRRAHARRSGTPSPTSSPAPSISWPGATGRGSAW